MQITGICSYSTFDQDHDGDKDGNDDDDDRDDDDDDDDGDSDDDYGDDDESHLGSALDQLASLPIKGGAFEEETVHVNTFRGRVVDVFFAEPGDKKVLIESFVAIVFVFVFVFVFLFVFLCDCDIMFAF